MKKITFLLTTFFLATQANALTVHSAELDAARENILVVVSHGGGCDTHKYSLKLTGCQETFPVQCFAEIIHNTKDRCEALVSDTVVFPLAKYGLDKSYYSQASLTIYGSPVQSGERSSATIDLP